MFRQHYGAIAAAVALAVAVGSYAGEADRGHKRRNKPTRAEVAVLNLSYVFKHYPPFSEQMAELEAAKKDAEVKIQAEKAEIARLTAQIEEWERGAPERSQMEREVAQQMEREVAERTGALTAEVKIQKEEFLRRQGRIHNEVYEEILEEVAEYSREHDIRLVLRLCVEPVDPDKPEEVLRRLNKRVIWYDEQVDITGFILKRLMAKSENETPHPAKGDDNDADDGPADRKKSPVPKGGKPGPESPSSLRPQSLS